MVIIGIDAHSRSHAAAAVDEHGRLIDGVEVTAGDSGLERLAAWIAALPAPRLVAVENARGYALALVRRLLVQGEELVDVPATLTCDGRRHSGQRGKHDRGDALVVARIALRDEQRLPRVDATVLDDELKLLADAREQLIVEAGRWRNRAHALLRVAAPGYQTTTGALASAGAVRRARGVARRALRDDPTRARLAVAALDRLTALEADALTLQHEIEQLLKARVCPHLLSIRGVGPIVAAKIGHTVASPAFAAPPPSPLTHRTHPRLQRPRPAPPPQPRRQPSTQSRPLHHRHGPSPLGPRGTRLPRAQDHRRKDRHRSAPLPQAPPQQRRLPSPPRRRRCSRLDIAAPRRRLPRPTDDDAGDRGR